MVDTLRGQAYSDESVPVEAEIGRLHPMVVFGDHRLCAGHRLAVQPMPGPHMHSQVEINFLLSGAMTYWLDGSVLRVEAGQLVIFWGMVPHQVTDVAPGAEFVCFYLPVAMVLSLAGAGRLRQTVLRGGLAVAGRVEAWESDVFLRWRRELMTGDEGLEALVRDELAARLRRLEREGWQDLCGGGKPAAAACGLDARRLAPVEAMSRFIADRGLDAIKVEDVAAAAALNPNYAMDLFRRAFGMTIKHAITRHRLDAAQSLLLATDKSVASLAFACGFGSLSSFYEAFEQRFSVTPTRFRKAMSDPDIDTRGAAH